MRKRFQRSVAQTKLPLSLYSFISASIYKSIIVAIEPKNIENFKSPKYFKHRLANDH